MISTVMIMIGFMAITSGCVTMPTQGMNERMTNLEGVVYGNTARISRVESRDNKLRAIINRCAKRTGQLEDRVGYTSPKVYAFWVRGFASGSSTLPEKIKAELDTLVGVIKWEKITIKEIVGYSDKRGSDKANLALAMRRAEAVKTYLKIVKNLNTTNIEITSGGETTRYGNNKDNRCVSIIGECS